MAKKHIPEIMIPESKNAFSVFLAISGFADVKYMYLKIT